MSTLEASELLNAHTAIQIGTYFDQVKTLSSGVKFASSNRIGDHYWNYAYDFATAVEKVPEVISEIRKYAAKINRECVLYVIQDTKPTGLAESLSVKSSEDEVWMTFGSTEATLKVSKTLNIERIPGSKPGNEFLTVFKDAYGSGPPDSPGYEGLPPEYVDSIANCQPMGNVKVAHFLGRKNELPVAISSVFLSPPWAGIYNVGTIHSERRQRYGWDLSSAAVDFAIKNNCKTIFLQTQKDSPVEKLYSKMGFVRAFVGSFLIL